jgi:hypothetical protein
VFESILESSFRLLNVLFSSRAFLVVRWMMLGSVFIDVALWGLYLAITSSHVEG